MYIYVYVFTLNFIESDALKQAECMYAKQMGEFCFTTERLLVC